MTTTTRRRATSSPSTETHIWPFSAFAELLAHASTTSSSLHLNVSAITPTSTPYLTLQTTGSPLSHSQIRTLFSHSKPPPWQIAARTLGADLAILSLSPTGAATIAAFSRSRTARDPSLHPAVILDWAHVSPGDDQAFSDFLRHTPWDNYADVETALRHLHPSGTLLSISNLTTNSSSNPSPQLDFHTSPNDILCTLPPSQPHQNSRRSATTFPSSTIRLTHSLRAYLEVLFLRPSFRIFLRTAIVRPRLLHSTLLARLDYSYAPRARSPHTPPPKPAPIRLGFDPTARDAEFGIMIYSRGRLIRPYLKVGVQAASYPEVKVVGIAETDFLTPTPNMQAFEKDKLYQGLMFALDRSLKAFLAQNNDPQIVRNICNTTNPIRWVMCDECGKWRVVQNTDAVDATDGISIKWVCAMNHGGTTTCNAPDDTGVKDLLRKNHLSPAATINPRDSSFAKRQRSELDDQLTAANGTSLPSPTFSQSPKPRSPAKRPRSANRAFPGETVEDLPVDSPPMPMQPRFDDAVWNAASQGTPKATPNDTSSPPQGFMQDLSLEFGGPSPELPPPTSVPFSGADLMLSRGSAALPTQAESSINQGNLSAALESFIPQSKARPLPYPGHMEAILQSSPDKMNGFASDMRELGKNSPTPLTNHYVDGETAVGAEDVQKRSPMRGDFGAYSPNIPFEKGMPVSGKVDVLKSSSSVSHEGASQREQPKGESINLVVSPKHHNHGMNTAAEDRLTRDRAGEQEIFAQPPVRETGSTRARRIVKTSTADDSSANGAVSGQKQSRHRPSSSPVGRTAGIKSASPTSWRRRSPRNKVAPPVEALHNSSRKGADRNFALIRDKRSILARSEGARGGTVEQESLQLSAMQDGEQSPPSSKKASPETHSPVKIAKRVVKESPKKARAQHTNSRKSLSINQGRLGARQDREESAIPARGNDNIMRDRSGEEPHNENETQHRISDLHPRQNSPRHPDCGSTNSDALTLAAEAAASAAKAVLDSILAQSKQRRQGGTGAPAQPSDISWPQIAISAAVAAGAAAGAATDTTNRSRSRLLSDAEETLLRQKHSVTRLPAVTKGSHGDGIEQTERADLLKRKLRSLISHLVPGDALGFSVLTDDLEILDVEAISKAIMQRVRQREKDEAERAAQKHLESYRVSQQIACESLRKIRSLVHVFLEEVVGVLRTDDEDEPVENQLEEYLRVLDVLPAEKE